MTEVTESNTETAVELDSKTESSTKVRDNTIEREYWKTRGAYLSKDRPKPLPEFLYHVTRIDPKVVKSIRKFGLVPRKSLDVPPDWQWGRKAVFLGDNPREDALDPVVVIRPDPLDPNWITTEVSGESKPPDTVWGNMWMHVGRIPKEQIVEIRPGARI